MVQINESVLIRVILLIAWHWVHAGEIQMCDNGHGECKLIDDCQEVLENYHYIYRSVKYCDEFNNIVCCPRQVITTRFLDTNRKFERECKRFSEIRGNCSTTPFIVNGIKAEAREFPFMALIGREDPETKSFGWICGGTLISRRFVLTAAHCFDTTILKPIYRVRLGDLDYATTTDDTEHQDFEVANYVLHHGYYDNDDFHNDIALIELAGNATLNEYVIPACLPLTNGNEFRQLTAAGWGQIKEAGSVSTHLLKVTLDRFDDEKCKTALQDKNLNLRTQVCAGSFTSTSDTCQGDSGGPIFVQHPVLLCMKQIVGVTSYGVFCGSRNVPGIYTRVHLYTDWIERFVWVD